jgi:hypothetical protein
MSPASAESKSSPSLGVPDSSPPSLVLNVIILDKIELKFFKCSALYKIVKCSV